MRYYINKSVFSTRGDKGISVRVGSLELFFSYDRLIAIRDFRTGELIIEENTVKSHTTARHLNDINPDKEIRLEEREFNKRLKRKLREYDLL